MNAYNHYYRTDSENHVVLAFSDAFMQPQENDIFVEEGGRHFNPVITNEEGQFLYEIVNGEVRSRAKEELDAELAARPVVKTPEQLRIEQLEAQLSAQNENNAAFMDFVLQTLGV